MLQDRGQRHAFKFGRRKTATEAAHLLSRTAEEGEEGLELRGRERGVHDLAMSGVHVAI